MLLTLNRKLTKDLICWYNITEDPARKTDIQNFKKNTHNCSYSQCELNCLLPNYNVIKNLSVYVKIFLHMSVTGQVSHAETTFTLETEKKYS